MSVVCARKYADGHILIAADTGVFVGDTVLPPQDKLISCITQSNQTIVFGTVGLFSDGVLLSEYLSKYHKFIRPSVGDIIELMSGFYKFASNLRSCDDTLTKTEEDLGAILMIVSGSLYYISGYDIFEVFDYCAIGAGQPYALGALEHGATPLEAVCTAAKLCAYVREPITNIEVDND